MRPAVLLLCGAALAADAARAAGDLDRLIGSARCRGAADCATVALPDQACGGPAGWRAYSRWNADPAQVQAAAARTAVAQSGGAGDVSTCMVHPDPGAVCAADANGKRVCRLRPPTAAGPAPLR